MSVATLYFGNCQMDAFAKIHKALYPEDHVQAILPHRDAPMQRENLIKRFSQGCTGIRNIFIVCQPGKGNRETAQKWLADYLDFRAIILWVPPLINTGLWVLYEEGANIKYGYETYSQGLSERDALEKFSRGQMVFEMRTRFLLSVEMLRSRETACRVHMSMASYIETHFQSQRLFYTQNHPSLALLWQCFRRNIWPDTHAHLGFMRREPMCPFQEIPGNPGAMAHDLYGWSGVYPHSQYDILGLGLQREVWYTPEYGYEEAPFMAPYHEQLIKKLF